MKDPTDKHRIADVDRCTWDGEEWPCTTVRKWRETKEYRIRELATLTEALSNNVATLEKKVTNLEMSMRRAVALIHALLNAHDDTELPPIEQEHTMEFGAGYKRPGVEHFKVTYKDMEWHA